MKKFFRHRRHLDVNQTTRKFIRLERNVRSPVASGRFHHYRRWDSAMNLIYFITYRHIGSAMRTTTQASSSQLIHFRLIAADLWKWIVQVEFINQSYLAEIDFNAWNVSSSSSWAWHISICKVINDQRIRNKEDKKTERILFVRSF